MRYSGSNSEKFWEQINTLNHNEAAWDRLYSAGCDLQDLEAKTLRELSEALAAQEETTFGPIRLCPICTRAMNPNKACGHCGYTRSTGR